MIRNSLISICGILFSQSLIAGGDAANHLGGEQMINACVTALKETNSTNIESGFLKSEWSTARVNWTSMKGATMVVFARNYHDSRGKDPSFISDAPQISCMLRRTGDVVRLESPEKKEGVESMVDLVLSNEEYEQVTFDQLVARVRQGIDVYTYDAIYDISSETLTKVGETKAKKLDPKDYKYN